VAIVRNAKPGHFVPVSIEVATRGGISTATALYNGGVADTLRLTTNFGYQIEGTPEHPVLTMSPEGPMWCCLSELQLGDFVAVGRNEASFGPERRPSDKAYLAGLLLGDGHLVAQKKSWQVSLTSADIQCIEIWRSYLGKFNLEPKTYKYRPLDHRAQGKEISSRILDDLWLAPDRALSKVIDPRWLVCDRETIRALLQGLFDSDGSADNLYGYIEFSSTSIELARQVHLLLLNFGIIAKLYRRITKSQDGRGQPSYRLLIRGAEAERFYDKISFRLRRKQERRKRLPQKHNTNIDVVPCTWELLSRLPLSDAPAPKRSPKGPQPKYAKQFMRKARHYREDGTSASYESFTALLEHPAVMPSQEAKNLWALVRAHYFWDRVKSLKPGRTQVYDLCVPNTQSFIANGIVCHNTTAALGLALRAAGQGLKVYIIQFMKGWPDYGELVSVEKLPNITLRQFGRPEFVDKDNPDPEDIRQAHEALDHARQIILGGQYDIVILDEINVALDFGLIGLAEVLGLFDARPEKVELVLTGRYAHPEVVKRADLVTEMLDIKHPYTEGVMGRRGIEY